MWLHVDAAYAGSAMVCPEFRWAFEGIDRADSLVVNPHKWLFTPQGLLGALDAPAGSLPPGAFGLVPEYLRTPDEVVSFSEYSPELGRPFRALKLWAVLRHYGAEGLRARVRESVRLAQEFEPGCSRSRAGSCARRVRSRSSASAATRATRRMPRCSSASTPTGEIFISHTKLNGRYVLRLAIGNEQTTLRRRERGPGTSSEPRRVESPAAQVSGAPTGSTWPVIRRREIAREEDRRARDLLRRRQSPQRRHEPLALERLLHVRPPSDALRLSRLR